MSTSFDYQQPVVFLIKTVFFYNRIQYYLLILHHQMSYLQLGCLLLRLPFIYTPQLKFSDAPLSSCVAIPVPPELLWTVSDTILIAPSAVGRTGAAPPGHKKYVANPTVAIPELTTLTVCVFPSLAVPVQSIVVIPVQVTLWSWYALKSIWAGEAVVH